MRMIRILKQRSPVSGSLGFFCTLCFLSCFWFQVSIAQIATTDPSEVRALNSIFQQWDAQAVPLWNISGEPCSGSAINGTEFESQPNNPAIICDCTFDSNTTCHITQLKVLDLGKGGAFPKELVALRYLNLLNIDKNNFTGPLPAFIGNMTALKILSIAYNAFSGPIPKELGNLKELNLMSFGSNNFSGTLPLELGNLVKLKEFYIDNCGLSGEIPSTFANLTNIKILKIDQNYFTGPLPALIGNMTALNLLSIAHNAFSGPIPKEFGNLKELNVMSFGSNIFSGTLPPELGNLVKLEEFDIDSCRLSGEIPSTFANLTNMQTLKIDKNNFTGPLPAFISNMTALKMLSIAYNAFSGPIPKELGNLKELNLMSFGSNNFSGTLPPELGNLVKLEKFYIDSCRLSGEIPSTFANLTNIKILKIDKNYFTGPLPAFISNMTALELLSIAYNAFSGPIPKEFGNLKELNVMSFGSNNFSGTLPPELGNLVKLEEFNINSCRLSGEIPSTFANLTNMQILWASDSPFSGNIPDFIGKWTKLTTLRFQGNSFEGPIPTSFSQLTSLNSLRISDIYNGSSSLDFIKNLKSLTDLNLRNALITGTIPSDIGEYQGLQILDLSFNNLTGQLPSALFNMSSLTSLFLGNNSLSGPLPSQKSNQLQNIDLSYNYLSGSFPQWVTPISQLNLVVNNFTFDNSNITLPRLNCLQRNFPCNRNAPRYANFSIKCGGPQMTGSDGILYEAEDSPLGPASFNVHSTEKWAVSNAGLFADRMNPSFLVNTRNYVTPELFQTSRASPGSLRYYGLGLQNGPYTVTLQFAETVFDSRASQTWESLGRRVFDIYIQGNLRMKDFDILKEAGEVNRAVVKNFNVSVSENYLEIHLFWAGKGTCCTPEQGTYGPIIAAVHAASDFPPTDSGLPPTTPEKKSRTRLIVGIAVPVGVLSLLLIFAVLYTRRRKSEKDDDEDLLGLGPRPNTFSYAELRAATEDFNPLNKLGEGGYGPVYKGTLSDGRVIAVKQLSVASHQGKSQFVTEIATISVVQHRNLVKLYGCCIEGSQRILVYEYLENKSLDQAVFGTNDLHLDWPTRFNILLGTARGLAYLHEESRPRIVHRDVKASNILLDAELSPKISDFGLAKLYEDQKTHISTRVAGTIGYLAPEYAMRGYLTEKADVFGFGVVALEILSGRPNSDNSLEREKIYLLEWAWTLHENDQSLGLVDPRLTEFDENEATRLIRAALLCTQASPTMRPSMSRVVAMLSGDIDIGSVISKPSYLTDYDFKEVTLSTGNCLMDDDTPSTEAKDSNIHLN